MGLAKQDRLTGRNGRVWQGVLRGETQDAIGARLGISQARVSQIVAEVRAGIPEPTIAEITAIERDRLARLYCEVMAILEAQHPVVSTTKGVIVRDDETGERLEDAGPKLAAISAAIKLSERISRLYGLDAPQRVEATVATLEQSAAEIAFQEHVAEAKARRAQARALLAAGEEPARPAIGGPE